MRSTREPLCRARCVCGAEPIEANSRFVMKKREDRVLVFDAERGSMRSIRRKEKKSID